MVSQAEEGSEEEEEAVVDCPGESDYEPEEEGQYFEYQPHPAVYPRYGLVFSSSWHLPRVHRQSHSHERNPGATTLTSSATCGAVLSSST